MDDMRGFVSELKGMLANYNKEFDDPVAALENYINAVKDLSWLTVDHMRDVRGKFHRGEFEGVNPVFAPKPVDLRKMLTQAHYRAIDALFKSEHPSIAAKPFNERTLEERQKHTTLRLMAETSNPYERLRKTPKRSTRQLAWKE